MKTIGIKLADGSFYPVLQEGTREEKQLELTTAHNNQTRVMVDMYRSKTCTIEDAEYVDTLQIDNLIAHPNGEANISFTVSLDEDNNLFAKIVDSETGAQSKTTITLVSRTLEERLVPDAYEIKETPTIDTSLNEAKENGENIKKAVIAGGLLAAAMNINKKLAENLSENLEENIPDANESDDEINVVEEDPSIAETIEETAIDESELMDDMNFSMDLDSGDVAESEEPVAEAEPEVDIPAETPAEEADAFNIDDLDLGDMPETDLVATEPEAETEIEAEIDIPAETAEEPEIDVPTESSTDIPPEPALDEADAFSMDDLDLPDMSDAPVEETSGDDDFFNMDDLDLGEDSASVTETESASDETDIFNMNDLDLGDMPAEDPVADEAKEDDIFSMDDLDLGDMPEIEPTAVEPDTSTDETDLFSTDDLDFGDMSVDMPATEEAEADIPAESALDETDIFSMDDLDLPDMNEVPAETDSLDFGDDTDIFGTDDLDNLGSMGSTLVAADPFNFDGLYDTPPMDSNLDETEPEEEEVSKKTKTPVVICIICAIICILATLLVLFIIPSKYNLIGKDKEPEKIETLAPVEPEAFQEPEEDLYDIPNFEEELPEESYFEEPEEVPLAKEDEVVIIEEAEKVVPVVPEVVEEKPADISYKIKWGDTLWDIADTYYKNPWRYKNIAKYNGIKNPDHIISGTIIAIPAE